MPYSRLASVSATRSLLDDFGLRAKYKLGQNFLVDDAVVGSILELAELSADEAVMEVGPGIGTLTSALLPRVAAVVAIEADEDMRGPLSVSCADYSERLALVLGDALRVAPEQVRDALGRLRGGEAARRAGDPVAGAAARAQDMPHKVVANLPYAVAAKLILRWMQDWPCVLTEVVMVQREVADRICAPVGTKEYGAYTAKLALHARVTGRFEVPRSCFLPAPHVESAVVRIDRLPAGERLAEADARGCSRLIDAAFSQRRKTLRNSLSRSGCPAADLDWALGQAGIDGSARAETLGRDDFVRLYAALRQRTSAWPASV
ncbi:MAG: 16S rRNA (adenine(1518)-N(6)/adenine(1519)-N(6))-dimethyltransferase RsmA [Coriobacteriales bacterium]|jgi:16S rRNA (adenine1518-N6/adenine1519-N6)-dimethyltransferase